MAGRAAPADLSVGSECVTEESGLCMCARRFACPDDESAEPRELVYDATSRPMQVEREAALLVIDKMMAADVKPKILAKNSQTEPEVVALALAMYFGQTFGCDQDAKDLFTVARTTDVRNRWVKVKLAALSQHGQSIMMYQVMNPNQPNQRVRLLAVRRAPRVCCFLCSPQCVSRISF